MATKGKRGIKDSADPYTLDQTIKQSREIIKQIQGHRDSKVLVFLSHSSINGSVAFQLNKILRRMDECDHLDVRVGRRRS